MNQKLAALSTQQLLDEYEFTVKTDHYDPMASHNPEFTVDELRAEVERRLGAFERALDT